MGGSFQTKSIIKKIPRIRLCFIAVFIVLLSSPHSILGEESYSLAQDDSIEVMRYPEHLNIRMAISLDKENIWYITNNNRLYKWVGNQVEDLSIADEEYKYLFATSTQDIWVHVYLKDKYRHIFKRFRGSRVEVFPDPDNFALTALWINNEDDIWAGGIVGTLLHFDGNKWNRHPGFTNSHITKVAIDEDKNGWVVVENDDDTYDLLNASAQSKQFQYQKTIHGNFGFLPNGIWQIKSDSLLFSSKTQKLNSFLVPRTNVLLSVIPIQKNVVYNYLRHTLWIGRKHSQPPFLLLIDSENIALKLTHDGQIKKLDLKVNKERDLTHFHKNGLNYDKEYAVGVGFLNDDSYLDIYTILPEYKNSLLIGEISSETNKFDLKEYTIKFNAAENQLTKKEQKFYDNGILIADLNNDGDEDLFITAHQGSNVYFENQNHQSFEDRTEYSHLFNDDAGHRWNMAIAGDVDRDGDLDLFVTREYNSNVFYLNNGFGQFKEVTGEANLLSQRGGMGCAFGDIDNDGDLDLFVANWRAKNRLYRNDGINQDNQIPMFTDISDSAGVVLDDSKRTTSAIFGDVDNDGDPDLFVVNRTDPNRLYLNNGHGIFQDVTLRSGLFNEDSSCEGAVFFDADNDGDLDLTVSCKGQNLFYRNLGNLLFTEESTTCGFVEQGNTGAVICGDFDNDGDIDLYAASLDKKSSVYVNLQNDQRFIKLHLIGCRSNHNAVGAKVYFYEPGHYDEPRYLLGLRTVEAGSGLASTNSKVIHFGTGVYNAVDCKIIFPSGVVIRKNMIEPGTSLKIEELTGRQKYWTQFKKQLALLPRQSDFQIEILAYFGFLTCILLIFPNVKRKKWKALSWHYILPVTAIILSRILLRNQNLTYRLGFALIFGAFSFVLVAQFLYQKFQQQQRNELTDQLWHELMKFQHGDWARSNLNQLLLFSQNITEENQQDKTLRDNLFENINTYIQLTQPSLSAIVKIGRPIPDNKNLVESVFRASINIYRLLENLKNKIQIGERLPIKKVNLMAIEIITLKTTLDLLSSQVEKMYECEIQYYLQSISSAFVNSESLQISFDIESIHQIKVRIRTSDLTPVIDNLIQNAKAATHGQTSPQLSVNGEQKDSRLFLHFVDNGKGIPGNKQKKIFKAGYTTSDKKNKGHGLAFSRQILKKYGGDIYLARSFPGKGAEFVVELAVLS